MPVVDLNRQKANYAESLATQWLSRHCLVRPVAAGTDIGIDLYCEAVIANAPFQHFWVQVKAIPQEQVDADGSAWFDFETRHLRYWARQPVPVYAFLVPVLAWPPTDPSYVFGVRLTDRIVRQGIPDQATIRYRSSEGFANETLDNDLTKFVREIVPNDYATLFVPKGIVAPIEQIVPSINAQFPMDVILPHLDTVANTVRFASEIALAEIIESRTTDPAHTQRRRLFRRILELFPESESTIIGMSAVANAAFLDGDSAASADWLRRARAKVQAVDFDPAKKEQTLAQIDQMLRRVAQ